MDHAKIEAEDFVERYVLGRLTAAERERFEAHYVDCPRCLDQLEWTQDLHGALKTAAADSAVRTLLVGGVFSFLARRSRGVQVLSALAAMALPAILVLALLLPRLGELSELRRPQVNTASVLLGVLVRSGEPAAEVTLLRLSERQRVLLEVDGDAAFESYRATLFDAAGEPTWQDRLRPNPWAVLEVTFPAGFFRPGDYRLDFAGLTEDGRPVELGSFRLRAEP